MNKSYVYGAKNKVIVVEKENLEMQDYCDNLNELLEEENLVEEIKKQINLKKSDKEKLREELRKSQIENIANMVSIIAIAIVLLAMWLITNSVLNNPIYLNVLIKLFGAASNLMIISKIVEEAKKTKRIKNQINTNENQLNYLKRTLPKEQKKLEQIKKESKIIETDKKVAYEEVDLSNLLQLEKELNSLEYKPKRRIRERRK